MSTANSLEHTFPFQITGIGIDHVNGYVQIDYIDPDEIDTKSGIMHRHSVDLPINASPEVAERMVDLLAAANAMVQAVDDILPGQPATIPGSARG